MEFDSNEELMLQAAEAEPRDQDALDRLREMGMRLVQVETELDQAKKDVVRLTALREILRRREMPDLMFEHKVNVIGVDNHVLTREPLIEATLPKEPDARATAINWLVDNKHGGVVKRMLTVELPKGDEITEHSLLDDFKTSYPDLVPVVEYDVHHSTYKALIKKLVQKGEKLPFDTLGVYVGSIVRMDAE
jgi:hypothetical protein